MNGNNYFTTRETGKTFDFGVFLCGSRIVNTENKENAANLQLLINKFDTNLKNIRKAKLDKNKTKKKTIKEEIIKNKTAELDTNIKNMNNPEIKSLWNQLKENKNTETILDLNNLEEEIKDEKLLKKEKFKEKKKQSEKTNPYTFAKELENGKFEELFKSEKKIVLILNKAKIHKAKQVKRISKILNIKLIYLFKYSSDLNPIERVWYSIKGALSKSYIENEIFLKTKFTDYFYKYTKSETITKNWKEIIFT